MIVKLPKKIDFHFENLGNGIALLTYREVLNFKTASEAEYYRKCTLAAWNALVGAKLLQSMPVKTSIKISRVKNRLIANAKFLGETDLVVEAAIGELKLQMVSIKKAEKDIVKNIGNILNKKEQKDMMNKIKSEVSSKEFQKYKIKDRRH